MEQPKQDHPTNLSDAFVSDVMKLQEKSGREAAEHFQSHDCDLTDMARRIVQKIFTDALNTKDGLTYIAINPEDLTEKILDYMYGINKISQIDPSVDKFKLIFYRHFQQNCPPDMFEDFRYQIQTTIQSMVSESGLGKWNVTTVNSLRAAVRLSTAVLCAITLEENLPVGEKLFFFVLAILAFHYSGRIWQKIAQACNTAARKVLENGV